MPSTEQLQQQVNQQLDKFLCNRLGVINLPHAVTVPSPLGPPIHHAPLQWQTGNVCLTVHRHQLLKLKLARIYLQVPPEPSDLKPHERLAIAIKRSAIDNGDKLSNDGKGFATDDKVFVLRCQCSFPYQGKKVCLDGSLKENVHRKQTYTSDKRNSQRGREGLRAARRMTTVLSTLHDSVPCKFRLTVHHDKAGFYMKPTIGCMAHCGHPVRPHLQVPTTLLAPSDLEAITDLGAVQAASGVAQHIHHLQTMFL